MNNRFKDAYTALTISQKEQLDKESIFQFFDDLVILRIISVVDGKFHINFNVDFITDMDNHNFSNFTKILNILRRNYEFQQNTNNNIDYNPCNFVSMQSS